MSAIKQIVLSLSSGLMMFCAWLVMNIWGIEHIAWFDGLGYVPKETSGRFMVVVLLNQSILALALPWIITWLSGRFQSRLKMIASVVAMLNLVTFPVSLLFVVRYPLAKELGIFWLILGGVLSVLLTTFWVRYLTGPFFAWRGLAFQSGNQEHI